MRTVKALLVAALLALPFTAAADDKPKEKVVVHKSTTESEPCDTKCGSRFKRFWIHTVGGTIRNGLKSGAKKIGNTF